MKIQINKDNFLPSLSQVISVIERRQTLPILGNVYIKSQGGTITLVGSDLETEITTMINNVMADDGEITVSAKKIFDICRALPDDSLIDLDCIENKMNISSGKSRFNLQTLSANEYPRLESNSWDIELSIPQNSLYKLLNSSSFAMAQQDVRYFLNGLLLEINSDTINVVATDGHRLAKNSLTTTTNIEEMKQSIVPRKAISEIIKFLSPESEDLVNLKINKSHISLAADNYHFISKLIDGRYPEYQKVIPNNLDKFINLNKAHFTEILTRTAILSNEKFRGISISIKSGILEVSSRNPDHEQAKDEMAIDYSGENVEIGFNVNYLLEATKECTTDIIEFHFKDPSTSGVIKETGNNDKLYLIMPMRI